MTTEAPYGPKMAALTDKQRGFIDAMFSMGGGNATKWAEAAGYSAVSKGSLKVQAHLLWHNEKIQAAIDEEAKRRFKGLVPSAMKTLVDVMDNPQSTDAARIKAGELLLNRGGFHGISEVRTTVEHIGDDPDQLKRISAMAAMLGLPVEQLLGRRLALKAPVIDTVAEEIPAEHLPFMDEEY